MATRVGDGLFRLKRPLIKRDGPAHGLALVSSGGLGDTVLFRCVYDYFQDLADPGEAMTLILRHDARKMGFLFPDNVEIWTVDTKRLTTDAGYRSKTFEQLYQRHFRRVISTDFLRHPNLDEALIRAARAKETNAMVARRWPKYQPALDANRRIYTDLFESGGPLVDKVLRWVDFASHLAGRSLPPVRVALEPPVRMTQPPSKPEVLIQPFSAVKAKQYPVEVYAKIIDAAPSHFTFVFLGIPSDLDANPEYRTLLERPNVELDTGSFEEISPRLTSASLVVSVDTALMHLATALGAPTICLASAAYVGEIVPYAPEITPDNVTFLYQPMDCQGCLGACIKPFDRGMYQCVAAVGADHASQFVLDRLK